MDAPAYRADFAAGRYWVNDVEVTAAEFMRAAPPFERSNAHLLGHAQWLSSLPEDVLRALSE